MKWKILLWIALSAAFASQVGAAMEQWQWGNCKGMTPLGTAVGFEGHVGPSTASYYWSEDWRYSKIDKWSLTLGKGEEVEIELTVAAKENSDFHVCWLARKDEIPINNKVLEHGAITLLNVEDPSRACQCSTRSETGFIVRCTDEYWSGVLRRDYEICRKSDGLLLAAVKGTWEDGKFETLCMAVASSQGGGGGREVHSFVTYSGRVTRTKAAEGGISGGGTGGGSGGGVGDVERCKVSFVSGPNGQGDSVVEEVLSGASVRLKWNVFTREGYLQDGWTDDDGRTYAFGEQFTAVVDKVFYPQWVKCCRLTFAPGPSGRGSVLTQDISIGFATELAYGPVFQREGYTQTGWIDSKGNVYEFYQSVCGLDDETLFPVWTPVRYEVVYDPGPEGVGERKTVEKIHDEPLMLPQHYFTRAGYVQTSWYAVGAGFNPEYTTQYLPNAPATLYPHWSEGCLITYGPGSDADGEPQTFFKRPGVAHVIIQGLFKRNGYRQVGWQRKNGNVVVKYMFGEKYSQNATLKLEPTWEEITHKVTYVSGGDDVTGVGSYEMKKYEVPLVLPGPKFKRENYLQIGWQDKDHGTKYSFGGSYEKEADLTLVPIWGLRSKYCYNVRCVPDDMSMGAATNLVKEFGVPLELPGLVSGRGDYVQVGWSRTEHASVAEYRTGRGAYVENASVVLYPCWVPISEFGCVTNVMASTSGGKYTVKISGTPPGAYAFCAWSSERWVKTSVAYDYRVWQDPWGNWPGRWTKLSVNLGAGNLYATLEGEITVKLTFSVEANGNASGRNTTYLVKVDDSNYLAVVIWQPGTSSANVDFDLCGGCGHVPSQMANYGFPLSALSGMPTHVGYCFEGFYDQEVGGNQYYDENMTPLRIWDKTGDWTLYAHWRPAEYSIRYVDVKGADNSNPSKYTVGDTIAFADLQSVDGFTFEGWIPSFIVPEDVGDQVVMAQWNAIPAEHYRVVFISCGARLRSTDVNCLLGQVFKLPPNTAQAPSGKRFAGWACSNGRRYDDGMLVFNLAQPGETVTMTAIWE